MRYDEETRKEGEDPLKKIFGANNERLLELKCKYDPANLFRRNHNLDPGV